MAVLGVGMIYRLFILFFLFLGFLSGPAFASPPTPQRCGEWTICASSAPTPTVAPTETPTPRASVGSERWHLPACAKSDELLCKNNCHGKFDSEYWGCVKQCLAQRCADDEKRPGADAPASTASQGCVELASLDCVSDCQDRTGAEASRCRRDCLVKGCPNASSLDIAKESGSPGALACERCMTTIGPECRAMCGSGVWIPPGGAVNGLGGLLCERSCISVRCGVSCGVGLP